MAPEPKRPQIIMRGCSGHGPKPQMAPKLGVSKGSSGTVKMTLCPILISTETAVGINS